MTRPRLFHAALLAAVLCALGAGFVDPHDYPTLLAETAPVIIVLPILISTARRFPLTPLLYTFIAIHCCILIYGGHYTYAETPLGDWMRDVLGTQRNPYDRLGHLFQGIVPALAARELLLRTSPLQRGKWLFTVIALSCLGISATYELIEWAAAAQSGQSADAFLGLQGDIWDAQKDMAMCGIGAILALLALPRWHDRQLRALGNPARPI